jgi:hypothetical protein
MFARRACRVATGVAAKLLSNTTTGTPHSGPREAGARLLHTLVAPGCALRTLRAIARLLARYSAVAFRIPPDPRAEPPSNAWICELARQKKMGETPIILLPVVAPEPYQKPDSQAHAQRLRDCSHFSGQTQTTDGCKRASALALAAIEGVIAG